MSSQRTYQKASRVPLCFLGVSAFQGTFMKNAGLFVLAILPLLIPTGVLAQAFNSGSDGSDGALNITTNTTLPVPPDGIFNFTTVTIAAGALLDFTPNPLNTPVYILATGDITLQGGIVVSAPDVTNTLVGGKPGPGGFPGGVPSFAGNLPGDGSGPGAGGGGLGTGFTADSPGSGGYGKAGEGGTTTLHGSPYGSPLLIPLLGGSGGGGGPNRGGGGGGGAILLASNTQVQFQSSFPTGGGAIVARGSRGEGGPIGVLGNGSGGAIRIVAPIVAGDGTLFVNSGCSCPTNSGHGRVRIDTLDSSQLSQLAISPSPVDNPTLRSVGKLMVVFPPVVPSLAILNVAGQVIAEGAPQPVQVLLFGSPTTQPVTIQARDFTGMIDIDVALTPDIGPRTIVQAQIDMATGNPAQTIVNVDFPVNVSTQVNAWTR